ncbi:MAG: YgiT-type zinc finger protein [bacterium]|nr:YgiT-type zinc finger protein [bacterium]
MKCSIQNCPGQYEDKLIVHTVRSKGCVVVIENVPVEVCRVCGDVLLRPYMVRHIEVMLKATGQPKKSVPMYEYIG